jgi:sulfur carrier protein
MQVTINGKPETIEAGLTVATLLQRRHATPQRVAVEINADLVVRADYDKTPIREGDQIEIVTFVGGG